MMGSSKLLVGAALLVIGFPSARALSAPPESEPSRPASSVAPAQVPVAPAAPPERLYLVEFTTGPAWARDRAPHEQLHFQEHSENLRRLRAEGRLVLGARYSDKGIVVLKAADEEEARAQMESDESVKAGVFRFAVFEFRPFYDGCVGRPDAPQAGRP